MKLNLLVLHLRLILMLPMWLLVTSDGSPEPIASAIFYPNPAASPVQREAIDAPFPAKMEAESPGVPETRISHHSEMNNRILIALIVCSTLLGGIVLFVSCFWIYRNYKSKHSTEKDQKSSESTRGMSMSLTPVVARFNSLKMAKKKESISIIDYKLLVAATNNFRESSFSGEGRSQRFYKACFDDKMLAAVKRIDGIGPDAKREYENEVNWLSKIQHQNIIKLLGFCINGETRFIIYEMMPNGSLEAQLHGPTRGSTLTWNLRMKIAVDIARGLEYLHENCNPPVIHRDLRPSNILLDSNFNAKISDFGLSVTLGTQNNNIKLLGSLSYVAPEYLLDGKLTDKSDVYAFGVILMELLMGEKPVVKTGPDQSQSLASWASQLSDRSKLPNIVDPVIKNTMDLKHLYQVAAVAVLCIQPEPSYRPLITDVLHSLIPLVPLELGGSLRVTEPVRSVNLP